MLDSLPPLVERHLDDLVSLRHRIHRMPEPAFAEVNTARLIVESLSDWELDIRTGLAGTGIVAELNTRRPGPSLALRADMDALPIEETTGLPYGSRHPGYAHSCGHDGHVAIVIGAARVLAELSPHLSGRVRFIFQPAEETGRGAQILIEQGILDDKLDAVFSLHGWPDLLEGTVGCMSGIMMASCDVIDIRIIGRGGHGARPDQARNPLEGMIRLVDRLHRLNNPHRTISLCTAHIGTQSNIIADHGTLSGTLRVLNPDIRRDSLREIVSLAESTCAALDLRAEVSFNAHTPPVKNDPDLFERFSYVGGELLGPENVIVLDTPSMGSEDFGYFLRQVPGLLFRLGLGPGCPGLHQSNFDFNDRALRPGVLMMAGLILERSREGLTS